MEILRVSLTKEPAFGLDAVWIDPSQRDYARTLGYTVVDSATAIATHLNTLLRNNASELLSHDETQQLLDKVAERSPKLVEDLVPGKLSLATITKVLQNILDESVVVKRHENNNRSFITKGECKDTRRR